MRVLLVILVLGALLGGAWWYVHRPAAGEAGVLYGNVDFRQAALAFDGNERIVAVLADEGDVVAAGQVLARMDTSRLAPQVEQAAAQLAAQQAALARLKNGSRPEEIAQARANVDSARADAANTAAQFARKQVLVRTASVSQEDADIARAAAEMAAARLASSQKALDLAVAGPRVEDIDQAAAQVQQAAAQLALLRQQLADAELKAPFAAVVSARLLEPGEMAAPSRPVLNLAERGLKWVRAYVAETGLAQLHPGEAASVTVDGLAAPLMGRVGFISPVAEFTPKTVQTEDLRTSLVYEVRIVVDDPQDRLRLGMPATVRLLPDAARKGEAQSAASP